MLNFLLTDGYFHLEIMKSSHPHMIDNGPRLLTTLCYGHFIIVGKKSVVWVSIPKLCRIYNVEYRSHVAAVHTQQHKGNW